MKSVLLSIQPRWCELIASGKKTLEVRKTRPKLETPFKVYIYETLGKKVWTDIPISEEQGGGELRDLVRKGGKVIGEFVCDSIRCFGVPYPAFQGELDPKILEQSCCTYYMLHRYAYHDSLYGWHISDLKIYDKPRKLGEFRKDCPIYEKGDCCGCEYLYEESNESVGYYSECTRDGYIPLTRAPQSWYYVEDEL